MIWAAFAVAQQEQVQIEAGLSWPEIAGGVAAILVGLGIISGFLSWLARRSRRRLEDMIKKIAEQVTPTNGKRLATYIEQNTEAIGDLREASRVARDIAVEARGSARHAHERIDIYLVGQPVIEGMEGA